MTNLKKLLGLFVLSLVFANSSGAATRVKMHRTKKGTQVHSHYRSKADNSKLNNYSRKGNSNPYTGKKGSK